MTVFPSRLACSLESCYHRYRGERCAACPLSHLTWPAPSFVHSISDPCARGRPARALPARRRLCCAWLARNRLGLSRADPTRAIPFRSARRSKFQFRSARLAPWSARSRPARSWSARSRSWSALLTLGSVAVGRLSLIPRARSATSRSACSSTARAPGSLAHGWLALAPRLRVKFDVMF